LFDLIRELRLKNVKSHCSGTISNFDEQDRCLHVALPVAAFLEMPDYE